MNALEATPPFSTFPMYHLEHVLPLRIMNGEHISCSGVVCAMFLPFPPSTIEKLVMELGRRNNFNVQNERGQTPLQYLLFYGVIDLSAVKFLVQVCNAQPNIRDNKGRSALVYACVSHIDTLEIVRFFIEDNYMDDREPFLLHTAVTHDRIEVLEYLFDKRHQKLSTKEANFLIHLAGVKDSPNSLQFLEKRFRPKSDS